jgi:hypothetical protein
MGNKPRKKIVVATARPRRAMNTGRSTKPEWMTRAFLDAAIVIATTLATTLLLLLISGQLRDTTAGSLIARSAAPALDPVVTEQPAPEQSSISHPTPSPPANRATPSPTAPVADRENNATTDVTDDTTIKAAIDKKLQDIAELSPYAITITISRGSVTVVGTVPSDEVKEKIEKLVRAVKGVKQIDNQVVVVSEG